MTADEVRGVVFQKVAIGGYKQSDVDLFLDEVAVCIESMTAKIRALEKAKFEAGKSEIQNDAAAFTAKPTVKEQSVAMPQKPVEKAEPAPQKAESTAPTNYGIESLLVRTQKLAQQIEEEARVSSQQLLEKTAEDAKVIIARADSQAAETLEKANAVLAEAERKEKSINAAARAEAENIINEAVARSGRMLTATREKLKNEQELCNKLRTEFSEVKNVIVNFYEEQLGELRSLSLDSEMSKKAKESTSEDAMAAAMAAANNEPKSENKTEKTANKDAQSQSKAQENSQKDADDKSAEKSEEAAPSEITLDLAGGNEEQ